MRYFSISLLISPLLAAALLYIVFREGGFIHFREALNALNFWFLLAAACLYFLICALRAIRFHLLMGNKIGFRDLLHIAFLHSFLSNNLPARSGELSYVYLLRKSKLVTDGENVGSLILARLFDLLAVSFFILVSLFFVSGNLLYPKIVERTIFTGSACIVLFVLLMLFHASWIQAMISRMMSIFHLEKFLFFRLFKEKTSETIATILRAQKGRLFFQAASISLLFWSFDFLFNWTLVWGSGLHVGFTMIVFAFSFLVIANIIPIQPLLGIGTYEGFLAIGLFLLGVSKEVSLPIGLIVHVQTICISFLFAAFGYIYLVRRKLLFIK